MSPILEHVIARLTRPRVVLPDPTTCGCGKSAGHRGRCLGDTDFRECLNCGATFRCRPSATRRLCTACKPQREIQHEPVVELFGGGE